MELSPAAAGNVIMALLKNKGFAEVLDYDKNLIATLRMQLRPVFYCSSLSTLDPGNGRGNPGDMPWNRHLAWSFYPRILVLGTGRFQAAVALAGTCETL